MDKEKPEETYGTSGKFGEECIGKMRLNGVRCIDAGKSIGDMTLPRQEGISVSSTARFAPNIDR